MEMRRIDSSHTKIYLFKIAYWTSTLKFELTSKWIEKTKSLDDLFFLVN